MPGVRVGQLRVYMRRAGCVVYICVHMQCGVVYCAHAAKLEECATAPGCIERVAWLYL
jgi:hypothetical protein